MSTIDPELLKYFEKYMDLFANPGWSQFVEDMQDSLDNNQRTAVARCKTNELWHEERGIQTQMMRITNFERIMRARYEELIESPKESEEEFTLSEDTYDLEPE